MTTARNATRWRADARAGGSSASASRLGTHAGSSNGASAWNASLATRRARSSLPGAKSDSEIWRSANGSSRRAETTRATSSPAITAHCHGPRPSARAADRGRDASGDSRRWACGNDFSRISQRLVGGKEKTTEKAFLFFASFASSRYALAS